MLKFKICGFLADSLGGSEFLKFSVTKFAVFSSFPQVSLEGLFDVEDFVIVVKFEGFASDSDVSVG